MGKRGRRKGWGGGGKERGRSLQSARIVSGGNEENNNNLEFHLCKIQGQEGEGEGGCVKGERRKKGGGAYLICYYSCTRTRTYRGLVS